MSGESRRRGAHGLGRQLASALLVSVIGGCVAVPPPSTTRLDSLADRLRAREVKPTGGSLWGDNAAPISLFQDAKASRVGDTVTVNIVENAQGTKSAETKTAKSSTLKAQATSFFGAPSGVTNRLNADTSFADSYDGSGSIARSGTLTAYITTVVTDVLPNGNLVVAGQRDVTINAEQETITLSGIVRPEDIDHTNTVLSTHVADAVIEYSGRGVINDKQRPGWAMRILSWIWPF